LLFRWVYLYIYNIGLDYPGTVPGRDIDYSITVLITGHNLHAWRRRRRERGARDFSDAAFHPRDPGRQNTQQKWKQRRHASPGRKFDEDDEETDIDRLRAAMFNDLTNDQDKMFLQCNYGRYKTFQQIARTRVILRSAARVPKTSREDFLSLSTSHFSHLLLPNYGQGCIVEIR
jgi:hypothetical protein